MQKQAQDSNGVAAEQPGLAHLKLTRQVCGVIINQLLQVQGLAGYSIKGGAEMEDEVAIHVHGVFQCLVMGKGREDKCE